MKIDKDNKIRILPSISTSQKIFVTDHYFSSQKDDPITNIMSKWKKFRSSRRRVDKIKKILSN